MRRFPPIRPAARVLPVVPFLLVALMTGPAAGAVTVNAGDIIAAEQGVADGVILVDPDSGAQTTVSEGGSFVTPSGVAVEADGDILVADSSAFGGGGGVIRVDPASGAQTTVSSGGSFVDPFGIAVEADGDILVLDTDAFGGGGGIIRVDPASGAQTAVTSAGAFVDPHGIALEADGDILVTDRQALPFEAGVVRVDPVTGTRTTVSTSGFMGQPIGVAVEADGDILVADRSAFSAVIRVNPVTGVQSLLSASNLLADPFGVTVEEDGSILVSDIDTFGDGGGVIRVDPVSGAQAMVSSVDTSTLLLGIAVVPSSIFQPTDTTLSCGDPVTVGDEARCTATVTAATAPAGTVAFTIDATGTLSPDTCTLAPASGTEATCAVRYTPSGDVPAAGRQDRLTAEFAPEDVTWSASDAETTVTVRARPAPPPAEPAVPANPPATPALSARALALSCSRSPIVLLSAARSGSRVRLLGAADVANAGQRVTIRTRRGDAVAARATVLPDGSFQATASLPRRRFVRKTFYYAELGGSRSPILKLTRRLTARVKASTGSVTIRGRVSPPLAKRVRPVVIRRLVSCESGFAVVARVRPDARGRFRVSLPRVGAGAELYRASTRVPHRGRRAGSLRTSALTLRVEPVP